MYILWHIYDLQEIYWSCTRGTVTRIDTASSCLRCVNGTHLCPCNQLTRSEERRSVTQEIQTADGIGVNDVLAQEVRHISGIGVNDVLTQEVRPDSSIGVNDGSTKEVRPDSNIGVNDGLTQEVRTPHGVVVDDVQTDNDSTIGGVTSNDGLTQEVRPLDGVTVHDGQMIRTCPPGKFSLTYSNGSVVCRTSCPPDMWQYDQTCVHHCPRQWLHIVSPNQVCGRKCPAAYFRQDVFCMPCHATCSRTEGCVGPTQYECNRCATAELLVTYNKQIKCVSECPMSYPYYQQIAAVPVLYKCLDKCPSLMLKSDTNRTLCVKKCPDNFKSIIDNKCITGPCPSEYKYHFKEDNITRCLTRCDPSYFNVPGQQECHDICPEPFPFSWTNFCLAQCPKGAMYYLRESRECLKYCPSYHAKDTCIKVCPPDKPRVYDGACHVICPDAAPYTTRDDPTCLSSCPETMVRLPGNSTHCLSSCPDHLPYSNEGVCSSHCLSGTMEYHRLKSCHQTCPESVFKYTNETTGIASCVDTCPNKWRFTANGTCLRKCPSYALYYASNGNNYNCVDKCPWRTMYHVIGSYECLERMPQQ